MAIVVPILSAVEWYFYIVPPITILGHPLFSDSTSIFHHHALVLLMHDSLRFVIDVYNRSLF